MNIREISGTGNGIRDEYKDDFIKALSEYSNLITEIHSYLRDNKEKWFDHKFHTMNNWHGMYKIEIPLSVFPINFCNTLAVDCWGRLQLAVFFPLKFNAPTFGSSTTDKMNVALVTEMSVQDINKFAKDKKYPIELRKEALLEFKRYYTKEKEEKHKEKFNQCNDEIKRLKAEVEKAKEVCLAYPDYIKKLEKETKKIEKLLANF